MPIDNNDAEQLMKQVALGSKNWMFIGSVDAGGYRAADLMSLVSGASGIASMSSPLRERRPRPTLEGRRGLRIARPDIWKAEAVRVYRVEERG